MSEEFNLSKRINTDWTDPVRDFIHTNDVKEFIKRLKEGYLYLHEGNRHEKLMIDKIDKLAGDKLLEGEK